MTTIEEKSSGLNQILAHYSPRADFYPFGEEELRRVAVYRVSILQMTGKESK